MVDHPALTPTVLAQLHKEMDEAAQEWEANASEEQREVAGLPMSQDWTDNLISALRADDRGAGEALIQKHLIDEHPLNQERQNQN